MLQLAESVLILGQLLNVLILIRVMLSWFPVKPENKLVRFIYMTTEPILGTIRGLINKSPLGGPGLMIDFSPIFAYLMVQLVTSFIANILISFA